MPSGNTVTGGVADFILDFRAGDEISPVPINIYPTQTAYISAIHFSDTDPDTCWHLTGGGTIYLSSSGLHTIDVAGQTLLLDVALVGTAGPSGQGLVKDGDGTLIFGTSYSFTLVQDVPEPAGLALLTLATFLTLPRRRQRVFC
jgi:hypothetical protein